MEENNLGKLKKKLYQKNNDFGERLERETLREDREGKRDFVSYWGEKEPEKDRAAVVLDVKKPGILKQIKFFIYLFIAFVFSASGAIVYIIYSGNGAASSSNVFLDASGPVYADGGQVSKFNFTVRNQNSAALEEADLIFDFPPNTFSAEGSALRRTRFSFGALGPGAVVNKSLDLVFFGVENEEKKINASLEYRFAESNAILVKEKESLIKISKAPLGLSLIAPKEAVSGQKIIIKAAIVSNSESTAKNLKMEMKYPTGFRFIGANPKPSGGDNVWSLGDLASSQKSAVEIEGVISGENSEERVFAALIGVVGDDGDLRPFNSTSGKVTIKKSPLNLSITINGKDNSEIAVHQGDQVRVDLKWTNNLPVSIRDARIEMEIRGESFEEKSISASGGNYRSRDKKIIWDPSSENSLAFISSGGSGRVQIGFTIKDPLPIYKNGDKNFSITVGAAIFGVGTSDEFENKEISDTGARTIKIGSQLQAVGRTLHHSGAFKNTGPMPPKVGSETTYTVVWSLANNVNDLSGVKITASLPPYVVRKGSVSPEDADLRFDEKDATLTWNVGDAPAGTGIVMQAKEIAFQVAFTPNLTQVGDSPVLVNAAKLEAYDSFADENIAFTVPGLTTQISDPQAKYKDDKVVE